MSNRVEKHRYRLRHPRIVSRNITIELILGRLLIVKMVCLFYNEKNVQCLVSPSSSDRYLEYIRQNLSFYNA